MNIGFKHTSSPSFPTGSSLVLPNSLNGALSVAAIAGGALLLIATIYRNLTRPPVQPFVPLVLHFPALPPPLPALLPPPDPHPSPRSKVTTVR